MKRRKEPEIVVNRHGLCIPAQLAEILDREPKKTEEKIKGAIDRLVAGGGKLNEAQTSRFFELMEGKNVMIETPTAKIHSTVIEEPRSTLNVVLPDDFDVDQPVQVVLIQSDSTDMVATPFGCEADEIRKQLEGFRLDMATLPEELEYHHDALNALVKDRLQEILDSVDARDSLLGPELHELAGKRKRTVPLKNFKFRTEIDGKQSKGDS